MKRELREDQLAELRIDNDRGLADVAEGVACAKFRRQAQSSQKG